MAKPQQADCHLFAPPVNNLVEKSIHSVYSYPIVTFEIEEIGAHADIQPTC